MRDQHEATGLRVVMLVNQFMPEVFAGAEQQCLRLSRVLLARGLEPHVLTSRSKPDTPAEEVMDGVPITRLWSDVPPQHGGRHILSSLSWMHKVNRWITDRRDQIDLVHCHHAKLNALVAVHAATKIGVPSIVKLGSAGPNFDFLSLEKKRFFYGQMAANVVRKKASAFIGISDEMMHDLAEYGIEEERRVLIPNGVEMPTRSGAERAESAARIRAEIGADAETRVAVFAGRMEKQKNVDTLLKAFGKIIAEGQVGKLVLLGDGALMEEHQKLAAELGLGDAVVFAGRVENVEDYLAAADLFVLPALAEGMSNAVLEAMAEGVPQVASEVSGNTDLIVHGETGWLYGPPQDVDALAQVLGEAFAATPERLAAMAEATRKSARDTFSIEAVAARYCDFYQQLTMGALTDDARKL